MVRRHLPPEQLRLLATTEHDQFQTAPGFLPRTFRLAAAYTVYPVCGHAKLSLAEFLPVHHPARWATPLDFKLHEHPCAHGPEADFENFTLEADDVILMLRHRFLRSAEPTGNVHHNFK